MTEDFGQNWTKVRLPVVNPFSNAETSTNNDSISVDDSVSGSAQFPQANYNISLAVDPNNAGVVYIGGTADANPVLNTLYGGFIRVDTNTVVNPYAVVAYDNSNNDNAQVQFSTQGAVTIKPNNGQVSAATFDALGPGHPYGMYNPDTGDILSPYFNMLRDPESPFLTPSTQQYTNIASFGNSGEDARYNSFDGGGALSGGGGDPEAGSTDQHQLVVFKDPITGATRLIFGDDQGIFTGTDDGTGNGIGNIGSAVEVVGSRNGNIQITQFYDGAAQPSTLAAQIQGALFYGVAQDDGFPASDPNVLVDGNLDWDGEGGDGAGVKTDPTGSGQVYYYKWPCCGGSQPLPTDFFTVITQPGNAEVSRTTGLIAPGDSPGYPSSGQWPFEGGSVFAVNPIDGTSIVMSSPGIGGANAGNIYLTSGPSLGTGIQWFEIATGADLDSTYAPALAFGAPANAEANPSDFIYAGTEGGHIYVTFSGGGTGQGHTGPNWYDISKGLDGSAVQYIVADPTRGSHDAYAVTLDGVYYMPDSSVASPTWVKITGNLFDLPRQLFNDPNQLLDPGSAGQKLQTLASLTAIQADWRYAIPNATGSQAIASASEFGNVVTLTTSAAHGLTVGETVQIAGIGVAGYNGTYVVASVPSSTTFTYVANSAFLPNSAGGSVTPTHPVLYVGGTGGVFRSFDQGKTWTFFPDTAIDGAQQEGGFFPSMGTDGLYGQGVTNLQLALGNINPLNGTPSQPYGFNMLVATTYGGGTYAIRLDDEVIVPGGNPLYTYAVNPVAGPHVTGLSVDTDGTYLYGIDVTFSGPVDPTTFTAAKVNSITDPSGNSVPIAYVADLGATNHNEYEIVFADPTTAHGFYNVSLGPNISDYAGDTMDQNENLIDGESPADIFSGGLLFQPETNSAPVLHVSSTIVLPSVNEDQTAAQIPGTSISGFINSLGPPMPGITDPDSTAYAPLVVPVGIAVTGVDDTNGMWQYSLDDGTSWTDFALPGVVASFPKLAVLLAGNWGGTAPGGMPSTDMMRYLPNPGFPFGPSDGTASFTFRAWDMTSGLTPPIGDDGGTADTTINGGTTAFSATSATATITVHFVNLPPAFTAANPPAVPEDISVTPTSYSDFAATPWITSFTPGRASDTVLAYNTLSVSNPNLFTPTGQPAVDNSGYLHFTLNPGWNGTTTFVIDVQETGGALNGGSDTSPAQTFTLTVNAPLITLTPAASTLASATAGATYVQTFSGSGGFALTAASRSPRARCRAV